jgi:hypothetical protein
MYTASSITVLWQFDPRGGKLGGIGQYVRSFIKYCPEDIEINLVGISSHPDEIGAWKSIEIASRRINFLPIVKVSNQNKKSLCIAQQIQDTSLKEFS